MRNNIYLSIAKSYLKDFLGYNYLKNVFKTNFSRNVLVSYITNPFIFGIKYTHTNYLETTVIAEVFKELGYNVDVVSYLKNKNVNHSKYEIIFGFGETVESILEKKKAGKPFIIWHGTGSHPFFSNEITMQRLAENRKTTGRLFHSSSRFLRKLTPLQWNFSDLIVLYGNSFTKSTFTKFTNTPIETIDGSASIFHSANLSKKDFLSNKKNYIWFGSKGAIHKGLDLLLDYFSKNKHLKLHICGEIEREFYDYYKKAIEQSSNISYHSFVDIKSELFKNLMETCVFTILPTCSEGMATSVLTTMANGGLIPIVTKNSGIDIHDFGILIKGLSKDDIHTAIEESQRLEVHELRNRSVHILEYSKKFDIQTFKSNFKNIIVRYINN